MLSVEVVLNFKKGGQNWDSNNRLLPKSKIAFHMAYVGSSFGIFKCGFHASKFPGRVILSIFQFAISDRHDKIAQILLDTKILAAR